MTSEQQRMIAAHMSDFYWCPNSGRVIDAPKHDDKVLCGCGRSNPDPRLTLGEGITGGVVHHVKRFLRGATVDDFIRQKESDNG